MCCIECFQCFLSQTHVDCILKTSFVGNKTKAVYIIAILQAKKEAFYCLEYTLIIFPYQSESRLAFYALKYIIKLICISPIWDF